jgi:hypothetical protein
VSGGIVWQRPPSTLASRIEELGEGMRRNTAAVGQVTAEDVQSYARQTAPWKDQSGDARAGLTGVSVEALDGIIIVLYHTMFYGEYLEDASGHHPNKGAYKVIIPTLTAFYGEIMARLDTIMQGA